MKSTTRWIWIGVGGLLLLLGPSLLRMVQERGQVQEPLATGVPYTAPIVATPNLAVTPIPTPTPARSDRAEGLPPEQLRPGPVVVDLAHFSLVDRAKFQPLAASLAPYGLDLRFWLPTVDTSDIRELTDFPDQSAELDKLLADASALVVISPFFLYTPDEIAVVKRFVADGGRLLVISDPDVESDSASDTNHLSTAFNIIFNQDYLYDTITNDENFTYFFQGEFRDTAEELAGSRVAFYGGRSIGGAVETQVRSSDTTLSSLRNGLTSFNTVVLGGSPGDGSGGRVLAMSDFDVLTDPFVTRHDNRRMLQYVADFLAGAERDKTIADFPGFLGKEVALAIDNTEPVGAQALAKAAELQRVLEASGRHLQLDTALALTTTAALSSPDLIYVGGYRAADSQSDLLSALDIQLVEEIITPTVTAASTTPAPTLTPTPQGQGSGGSEPLGPKETPTAPLLPQEPGATLTPSPETPPEVPEPLETPSAPEATVEPGGLTPTAEATATLAVPATATPALTAAATPVTVTPLTVTSSIPALLVQAPDGTPGVTETVTPTLPAGGELITGTEVPAGTVSPAGAQTVTGVEPSGTVTPTVTLEASPTPEPQPQIRLLLDRGDGLRLIADETLLYVRRTNPGGSQTLAVLGSSEQAISAAMTRLLNRDFGGCLLQTDLVICPYAPGESTSEPVSATSGTAPAATPTREQAGSSATPTPQAPPAPGGPADILVLDDNLDAVTGEPSDAAVYLTVLTEAGYTLDNWVTSDRGMPEGEDLQPYEWVIWSDAGYASSGIDGDSLRVIGEYINDGGRLTISSRMPFFGVSAKSPSVVRDVTLADEIPELTRGLPTTPIVLNSQSPVLVPLEENPDPSAGARSALLRGPASVDAGAPLLILLSDEGFEEPKGALLMLFGLSMGWLPPDVSAQLIENMAELMLAE